jgi:hypothetical protein
MEPTVRRMNTNDERERLLLVRLAWRRLWKWWLLRQLAVEGWIVGDVLAIVRQLDTEATLSYKLKPGCMGRDVEARRPAYGCRIGAMTSHLHRCGYHTIELDYPGYDTIAMSCCGDYITQFQPSARVASSHQWFLLYSNALGGAAVRNLTDKRAWTICDVLEWLEMERLISKRTACEGLATIGKIESPPQFLFARFTK